MSGRRLATLMVIALVLGSLPLASSPQAEAGWPARNQIQKDGFTVTIVVPVDIRGLGGRTFRNARTGERRSGERVAEMWEQGAEEIWNLGFSNHTFRGCYTFVLDIQMQALGEGDSGNPNNHQVQFKNTLFVAPNVRARVTTPGGRPAAHADVDTAFEQSLAGLWGRNDNLITAHEVGHLLGLADDYTTARGSDGVVSFTPLSGRAGTLMARGTIVDEELVKRVGELVADHEELPPCILGVWESRQMKEEGIQTTTATVSAVVRVVPTDQGQLEGTVQGEFQLEGVAEEGGCQFNYSAGMVVDLELSVEGEDDGPYSFDAKAPNELDEIQRHYLCEQAIDLTLDWDVSFNFDGIEFTDGQYIDDQGEDGRLVLTYLLAEQ